MKFTGAHSAKLTGDAEAIHRNTDVRIAELQAQVQAIETFGRLLVSPLRLTGTGTGRLPAGTCMIRVRMVAQGGGGGGATTGAGAGAGGGGSSGEIVEFAIGTPGVPLTTLAYSWAMGSAAGGGGSSAGGNGVAGADSTFTHGGITYTAKGGGGATGMVGTAGNGNANPTATPTGTPAVGVSGVLRRTSDLGDVGEVHDGNMWFSGSGGGTEFGTGGLAVGGLTAGNPGVGAGSGGSGAAAATGGGRAGGAGAAGEAIAEFYG